MLNKDGLELVKDNYQEYARYIIETRAYPDLVDGCKAVQRRCIHQTFKDLPKHLVKSANAIGVIVRVHPHPSAIYGVLVSLAQPDGHFPLYDTQGNWGSRIPESEAAAERYTELKISNLASKIFESFSDYVDMVEGEMNNVEPERLATFLPLCFLQGSYGIPVGMSTVNIPALNALDMIQYCIEVLKSGDFNHIPDVLVKPNVGNVYVSSSKKDWLDLLSAGEGRITYSPKIEIQSDRKSLVITGVPEGKTFEHVMKILSTEIDRDQIDVRDETTNKLRYVVEILPYKKVSIETLEKRLRAKLTVNESYRFIFADRGIAVYSTFYNVMKSCLEYLKTCCERWIDKEILSLDSIIKVLSIIEEMKKDGSIVKLATMNKDQAIQYIIKTYQASVEQAKSVLSKPISYLTKEHHQEIKDLKDKLKLFKSRKSDINGYLIEQYEALIPEVKQLLKGREMTSFVTKKISSKGLI